VEHKPDKKVAFCRSSSLVQKLSTWDSMLAAEESFVSWRRREAPILRPTPNHLISCVALSHRVPNSCFAVLPSRSASFVSLAPQFVLSREQFHRLMWQHHELVTAKASLNYDASRRGITQPPADNTGHGGISIERKQLWYVYCV
jgi:hypothetical protein